MHACPYDCHFILIYLTQPSLRTINNLHVVCYLHEVHMYCTHTILIVVALEVCTVFVEFWLLLKFGFGCSVENTPSMCVM